MKKILLILSAATLCLGLNAQGLVKKFAKNDKLVAHTKKSKKASTWVKRGDLLVQIFDSEIPEEKELTETPLKDAFKCYIKSLTFEKKPEKAKTKLALRLNTLKPKAFNHAITFYEKKDYAKAFEYFELAYNISNENVMQIGVDTALLFNVALSADNGNVYDQAVKYYGECADLGYKGASPYTYIAGIYERQKNNEKFIETVKIGYEKYPNDQNLLVKLINYYLTNDKPNEAFVYLDKAIAKEPENATYHYAKGTLFDKLKKVDEAVACYQKAWDLKPDYFNAVYNIGVLYYNNAANITTEASNLDLNEVKKYNTLIKKSDAEFARSLPFMEKAHELKPEDITTMETLKTLYHRMKKYDKKKEIEAKLQK